MVQDQTTNVGSKFPNVVQHGPNMTQYSTKTVPTRAQPGPEWCENLVTIVGVTAWLARGYFIPGGASQRGGGQAPAFHVASCQTWLGVGPKTSRKLSKITQKLSKSAKVNMLKSGDVSFDFGFELCLPTQQQDM